MFLALAHAVVDAANAMVLPKAEYNRLQAVRKEFGDESLILTRIGKQELLLPESFLRLLKGAKMEGGESLWSWLKEGAARGDLYQSVLQRGRNAKAAAGK